MRIAEYKKIDEKIEEYTVTIPTEYDEEGNIVVEEHEETRTKATPIMGMVYRDMTDEEIAEMEKSKIEPSKEEQIQSLKDELTIYDYIGVKIAMGVATVDEYKDKIAYTETLREQIRALESE